MQLTAELAASNGTKRCPSRATALPIRGNPPPKSQYPEPAFLRERQQQEITNLHAIHLHHERREQTLFRRNARSSKTFRSFFPGAKIGLLGLNGAGKSTVLKIMAGVDKDFTGEARPNPGTKVGYLPQEPLVDGDKPCAKSLKKAWWR